MLLMSCLARLWLTSANLFYFLCAGVAGVGGVRAANDSEEPEIDDFGKGFLAIYTFLPSTELGSLWSKDGSLGFYNGLCLSLRVGALTGGSSTDDSGDFCSTTLFFFGLVTTLTSGECSSDE